MGGQAGGVNDGGRDADVQHGNAAGTAGAGEVGDARLGAGEGEGRVGDDGRVGDGGGVRVDAGGQVNGEYGRAPVLMMNAVADGGGVRVDAGGQINGEYGRVPVLMVNAVADGGGVRVDAGGQIDGEYGRAPVLMVTALAAVDQVDGVGNGALRGTVAAGAEDGVNYGIAAGQAGG